MTTLSSAADVLRCYSDERRDLTVTQVARILEMPKSNASRLLRAMSACGLLEPVGASKRYRPGVAAFEAGRHYRLTSPFAARLDLAAATLCVVLGERIGAAVETVMVMERDGPHILCVAERGLDGPIDRPAAPRRAATVAAAGHALLARVGDEAARALMKRAAAGYAPVLDERFEVAMRGVALARRRGFATLDDARGRTEIAAAIGDPQARKEAALTVLTREPVSAAAALDIARILHAVCADLAGTLRDGAFAPFRGEVAAEIA